MQKKNLAIFDLDGTLFDTKDVNYLAYKQAMETLGYTISYEYFCQECNGRHYKEFLNLLGVKDEIHLEHIHVKKKEYYANNLEHAKIHTHLFNIIDSIKDNYYLAVVTTASRKNCLDILNHFDKSKIFDLILTHEDVSHIKPNPEGFLKAIEYFKMKKEDTIIFEDSQVGIAAAKATGANVFIVENFI